MAAIKFYYQYDRDSHKGKVVLEHEYSTATHYVDQIVCMVRTNTKRSDGNPKFIVEGTCEDYLLDASTGETVMMLI